MVWREIYESEREGKRGGRECPALQSLKFGIKGVMVMNKRALRTELTGTGNGLCRAL